MYIGVMPCCLYFCIFLCICVVCYSLVLILLICAYPFLEVITTKQHLGGLLLLLPQRADSKESEGKTRNDNINDDGLTMKILAELEKLFAHAHIPVSII